jgi:arylsulfatase A-like enzyme
MKAIVLIARGLQAGALGCYGNQWTITPALDALAAEGIVFDWHFADNADPAGARRAWRSGHYQFPPSLSAPSHWGEEGARRPDLLNALRQHQIHTCLILDDSRPSPSEFAASWDVVERVAAAEGEMPLDAVLETVGKALEQLERRDNWLLWIDLATLLPPWNMPADFQEAFFSEESDEDAEEFEEADTEESKPLTLLTEIPAGPIDCKDDHRYLSLQTSYAAMVRYVDTGIGQLLQALDGLEGGDDILRIVTTDTGQNLGEHGIVGTCRPWLHDELIHLPFLLRLPGAAEAGRRISALTQAVDLAPTLADWFGAPLADVHGRSLLPLARGEIESIRPYACAGLQVGDAIEYALRTPEWAFLLPIPSLTPPARGESEGEIVERAPQLYVKPDDRWEVNNVLQHHLELAEQLERTLRDFVTKPG